jgi:hypothetical protein
VFDEQKREVRGDNVDEVWKEAYRTLGNDDENDAKFSKEFRTQIIADQEMIYDQSFEPDNVCAELDEPIELEEVEDAIRRLKLAKSPGNDQIVAEILKRGGDQVANDVHSLCTRLGEKRNFRPNGHEVLYSQCTKMATNEILQTIEVSLFLAS